MDLVPRPLEDDELDDEEFVCPVCLNILLEPTTLTCGHNVCRVCLAGWYLSNMPRKNECPTCRQKWEGNPQVNKTLRNIVERREPLPLAERRLEMAENPDYAANLQKFESELQQTRQHVATTSQNSSFFAGAAVAIIACVVVYFFIYWSGGSGDRDKKRSEKPVVYWGTTDVSEWLKSMGWAHNYSVNAKVNNVDGPMLMRMDEDDLLSRVLNVTDPYHRSALLLALQSIKDQGVMMPQTIWEFKALYPGRSLYFSYALKDFPRTAALYLYLFYYEECFLPFVHTVVPRQWTEELSASLQRLPDPDLSQLLMFFLFMMVFPYGMVGLFAWSLRSAHTVTHLVVMATCLFQTLFELSFLSSFFLNGRWRDRQEWKTHLQSHTKQLLSMMFYVGLWPITPAFLCNFFFYVCLFVSPIQMGKKFYDIVTNAAGAAEVAR